MFACRVLVGQYTKGESHYCRRPARDTAGNLYDSCVNDVREPTIYVVFERSQVYPEFLITYEKTRFPKDNIIQSHRTRNASEYSAIFDAFDVSQTASRISTSSPHKANNITSVSDSTNTGATLTTMSFPTIGNPRFAALDSPAKDVSSDSQTDDTKSLNVIIAPPKSELSIHSKPTPSLTSLSRLLKESAQGLSTSAATPVFSSSDSLLIAAQTSRTDNSIQSGIVKNQQETLTAGSCNLATERSQRSEQESQNSVPECSCSSDKAKIFDASSDASEMESKTSMPSKTACTSAHKQCPSDGSLSRSLVSFDESWSSEKFCQNVDAFDDTFNVSQTASVISTSSPHKAYITSGSIGEEVLTSKPAQGLTSLSYTGLPKTSAQLTSVKIPVSSHSGSQLPISGKPSLIDRSTNSKLRPDPDLITTQTSHGSQKPIAHKGVVTNFSNPLMTTPSSTAGVRNPNSEASSASNHSAIEKEISVMYKTSSSSADKQSRSDGSLSNSSVSFYEMQPSALFSTQTHPNSPSPQQASRQVTKNVLEAQRVQKKGCVVQ